MTLGRPTIKTERTEKYEKKLKYNKELRKKIHLEVLIHYGGNPPRCACEGCYYHTHDCPTEFLTIDHINGGGRKHRAKYGLTGGFFYLWLKSHHYPKGYRVLCYNCNCSIGHHGYCPHDKERECFADSDSK